ncbi:MAG: hypothetical protein IT377_05535 [Polyangiaceae bacterium]|nr:hypothetical protein [Polyangiaceae bacterium]
MLSRRELIVHGVGLGLFGCARREPETPLAHLHGKAWVSGAYTHYAEAYLNVERRARAGSFDAYRLLAQRGVVALDALQQREVPFYVQVAADDSSFRVQRTVPERLTFTAEMSAADRDRATRAWKLAREHIHTDYEEIRRLDFALGSLLTQVVRVRRAIDEGRVEQFRLVRQLGTLNGGGTLPFELPYQVGRQDYHAVLLLVLARVEADRQRLARVEAAIVAVGLTARATDAGSASLAANVRKVLLGVARQAEADASVDAVYPERAAERAIELERGRALERTISASPEYQSWLAARQEEEDALGKLLLVLDSVTGLPTSSVYRQVMRIWRGSGDYLEYLRLAAAIVPGGSGLRATLDDAVGRTETYRAYVRKAGGAARVAEQLGRADGVGGALLNLGTEHARRKLDQQLAFFEDRQEADRVASELAETSFVKDRLPVVPRQ